MKSFPNPLTPSEEKYYMQKYTEGDLQAKHVLIERNLRLVAHVIKKYQYLDEDPEDLISIGTIGLIKAVVTFNPDKGNRLAAYASKCVENEILMYLRRNSKTKSDVSLDEPLNVDWDGNELLLSDILGTETDEVYGHLEEEVNRRLLGCAMEKLSGREREIVEMRFGLAGSREMTQKEVAERMGISQSYISRLEKKIIGRLQSEIRKLG